MMYTITYSPEAKEGLAKLKHSEPQSFKKAVKLLNEIAEHPKTGTGHPEPLKGFPQNRILLPRQESRIYRRGSSLGSNGRTGPPRRDCGYMHG